MRRKKSRKQKEAMLVRRQRRRIKEEEEAEILTKLKECGNEMYEYMGRDPIDVSDWNTEIDCVYDNVITDPI